MGHGEPLLPIARATAEAGHAVAFACRPSAAMAIEAAGYEVFRLGAPGGSERRPLVAPDAGREDEVLKSWYASRLARERSHAIVGLCATWRPDVIVCDEVDFGCIVAAERVGLPHAQVVVVASGSFIRRELIAGAIDEVRAEHHLASDPSLAMLDRHLVVAPIPPSFRDPRFPLPSTAHAIRPGALGTHRRDELPVWLGALAGGPSVYFTLGTEFNVESGDLFTRVLDGLRALPIEVIVTVGPNIDPSELGAQPANVHIERYLPHAALLPHCDLVVSHGGSGTVVGALAHGLPSLLLPMGADQMHNAARCDALGVGRTLDVVRATSHDVGEAAAALLADGEVHERAARLRDEARSLPGAESVVPRLVDLVRSASSSLRRR
jgi:UDP:flavonoid glycosyltransferase YjiC (YdhE family)